MRNSFRGDLVKQLRRPSDFYRGQLAEDYDGIGQYILVSMSRGSTAAALRARIAAGDFGGGRVFPVGTPVVMHSHHGQLEVLSLGNLRSIITGCTDAICGITDTFTRTVASGLSNSDAGPLWTVYGTASVDGEKAILANGADAELFGLTAFTGVTVTAQLSAASSGRVVYLLMSEGTPGSDFIEVDFRNDGRVNLFDGNNVTGVFITLGWGPITATKLRLVVTGNVVDAYVWQATDPMPSTPTLSLTGTSPLLYPEQQFNDVWIGSYGGTGTYDTYFDNLDITGVNRCTAVQFDDFNRVTVSPSVGTSTDGHAWTPNSGYPEVSGGTLNCNGSELVYNSTGTGEMEIYAAGPGPWAIGSTFTMTTRFKYVYAASNNRLVVFGLGMTFEPNGLQLSPRSGNILRVVAFGGATSSVNKAMVSGTWYRAKWEHDPANNVSRARVWADTDPEPATWDVTRATSGDSYAGQTDGLSLYASSGPSFTATWDYIEFDYVGKPCY